MGIREGRRGGESGTSGRVVSGIGLGDGMDLKVGGSHVLENDELCKKGEEQNTNGVVEGHRDSAESSERKDLYSGWTSFHIAWERRPEVKNGE
jgi:hypothetical protein